MVSRKAIRKKLKELLEGISLLQDAYHYKPHTFEGQSPVIYITSSGTNTRWLTGQGFQNSIYVNLHICTLYASTLGETIAYQEEQAEDLLDDIEAAIRNVLKDNAAVAGHWQGLRYFDRSNADTPMLIEGDLYLHEIIPLVMEVSK